MNHSNRDDIPKVCEVTCLQSFAASSSNPDTSILITLALILVTKMALPYFRFAHTRSHNYTK